MLVTLGQETYITPYGDSDPERIIVSMIEFSGFIYVATERGVYRIVNNELVRLRFVEDTSDQPI